MHMLLVDDPRWAQWTARSPKTIHNIIILVVRGAESVIYAYDGPLPSCFFHHEGQEWRHACCRADRSQ